MEYEILIVLALATFVGGIIGTPVASAYACMVALTAPEMVEICRLSSTTAFQWGLPLLFAALVAGLWVRVEWTYDGIDDEGDSV